MSSYKDAKVYCKPILYNLCVAWVWLAYVLEIFVKMKEKKNW